jgi:hypothetical protein
MSFHIAVFITSEKCGHCRTMRGNGILMSKTKIEKEKKTPTVPGNYYYDATFMKKLIMAGSTDSPRFRIVNVHYNSFNPTEGVMDISVFTLEPDNKTIRQTMFKGNAGKTLVEVYAIGDAGKKVSDQNDETKWEDTVAKFIPKNIPAYAYFFPTLTVFHMDAWMSAIRTNEPVYGYVNGMNTKEDHPYGALPGGQPSPGDFVKYLESFYDGTRKLLDKPEKKAPIEASAAPASTPPPTIQAPPVPSIVKEQSKMVRVPTKGACDKMNVRLYVKE